jgi:hypothetical protein
LREAPERKGREKGRERRVQLRAPSSSARKRLKRKRRQLRVIVELGDIVRLLKDSWKPPRSPQTVSMKIVLQVRNPA